MRFDKDCAVGARECEFVVADATVVFVWCAEDWDFGLCRVHLVCCGLELRL